jgi:UPF0755 protein
MDDMQNNQNRTVKLIRKIIKWLLVIFVAYLIFYFISPPKSFPQKSSFTIGYGTPLGVISYKLKNEGYIRSRFLFEGLIILKQNEKSISDGEYYFEKPINLIFVALRLTGSNFGLDRLKITIPEGYTRTDIAKRCEAVLANCSATHFLEKTIGMEGYLFPDTYLLFPSKTEDDLIAKMKLNFENKTKNVFNNNITQSEQKDIIIMASILEREANGDEDIKTISGILKNRLRIGMPLQVDATFYYLLGKESSELTLSDLKMKSPYNTYVNKGLPPGPIGNPGLKAIEAAMYPSKTDYLYYLHDKKGVVHYAKTNTEHVKNKRLYLK